MHSYPYHPQTNGAIEVSHKEIQKYICYQYLKDKEGFYIQRALFKIIKMNNNKDHSTTKLKQKDIRDIENEKEIEDIKNKIIKTFEK